MKELSRDVLLVALGTFIQGASLALAITYGFELAVRSWTALLLGGAGVVFGRMALLAVVDPPRA